MGCRIYFIYERICRKSFLYFTKTHHYPINLRHPWLNGNVDVQIFGNNTFSLPSLFCIIHYYLKLISVNTFDSEKGKTQLVWKIPKEDEILMNITFLSKLEPSPIEDQSKENLSQIMTFFKIGYLFIIHSSLISQPCIECNDQKRSGFCLVPSVNDQLHPT